MNTHVVIDLTSMYFACKNTGNEIDYPEMVDLIEDTIELEDDPIACCIVDALTMFSNSNSFQKTFLYKLGKAGFNVHRFEVGQDIDMCKELDLIALKSKSEHTIIVSGDPGIHSTYTKLIEQGKMVSICFFGSEISWLSDEFKLSDGFIDLESAENLERIKLVRDKKKDIGGLKNEDRLEQFSNNLERSGMFSRRYDKQKLQDLYNAGSILHTHLCRLDDKNFNEARHMSVVEFANAYAKTCDHLRKL